MIATYYAATGGETLLAYQLFTQPDPLQVGAANAVLTLVASNPRRDLVTVQGLAVTIPVGTNASDLTANAGGLQVQVPQGWSAALDGGQVTFKPQGAAGEIGPAGISFVLAGLTVNAQVGTAMLVVDETASTRTVPVADRLGQIDLPKFPAQFFVSDLSASPLDVPAGGATTLMWTGAAAATYTLKYQPADQGTPVSQPVGNTGPYTAAGLTRSGMVTFTLVVQVAVPGQDQPLTVQRQAAVSVETLSASLSAEPPSVGEHGLVRLAWSTTNAAQCRLDPGGAALAGSGTLYLLVQRTTVFTLTAQGGGGEVQRQVTVTVDPSIVPNTQGYQIVGADGADGADGQSGSYTSSGSPGQDGGDAILQAPLPPLDPSSAPARVIPISLTGGRGGRGGSGGSDYGHTVRDTIGHSWHYPPTSPGGNGANGGRGGDAKVIATFDPAAGPPAQYVIILTPGPGAPGGAAGTGTSTGGTGSAGRNGVASLSFNGVP